MIHSTTENGTGGERLKAFNLAWIERNKGKGRDDVVAILCEQFDGLMRDEAVAMFTAAGFLPTPPKVAINGSAAPATVNTDVRPEDFDFNEDPPEPDWVVVDLLERKTVNVLSADTGGGKSIHAQDLTVRLAAGDPLWMGREIRSAATVLYLDEENPHRIAHSRLKALSMDNESKRQLRYFRRQGIQLGTDAENVWVQWLERQLEAHPTDVVVVDTAMAVLDAEVNNNDDVVAAYKAVLRPIAEKFNLAVL